MRWLQPTALLILVPALLYAEPAAAQAAAQAGTPSAEVAKQADTLYQEASRLLDEKKWAEAEQKLLAAWALNPTFDVATNLGQAQARLGKYREAAQNLAFALRHWPLIGEMAAKRARAQKRLDDVRQFVASVTVLVNVPDAELLVDGRRVGRSPMKDEIFLDPGTHSVEATLAGHEKAAQKLEAAKGATHTVTLTLKPAAAPNVLTASPKIEPAKRAQPEAEPAEAKQPEVTVQPVKTTRVDPQPPPQSSPIKPHPAFIIASGALALGGIGAGIGMTAAANGKAAEATEIDKTQGSNSACYKQSGISIAANCGALKEAVDDKYTFTRAAQASFILGGAFALTAAGLGVWAILSPKAQPNVRVAPVLGQRRAAFVLMGTW